MYHQWETFWRLTCHSKPRSECWFNCCHRQHTPPKPFVSSWISNTSHSRLSFHPFVYFYCSEPHCPPLSLPLTSRSSPADPVLPNLASDAWCKWPTYHQPHNPGAAPPQAHHTLDFINRSPVMMEINLFLIFFVRVTTWISNLYPHFVKIEVEVTWCEIQASFDQVTCPRFCLCLFLCGMMRKLLSFVDIKWWHQPWRTDD